MGTIESFNFGQYLNNLDYAICIERQPDTCRVIYTSSDANFGIEAGVTNTMPGVGDELCANDYLLLVGGSKNGEGQTKDRYCGGVLSYSSQELTTTPVISKANGPIVIRFHSDSNAHLTLKEGFRVKYEQSPTDCSVLNSANANPQSTLNNPNEIIPSPVAVAIESPNFKPIKLPMYQSENNLQSYLESKDSNNNNNRYNVTARSSHSMSKSTRANGKHLVF